MEWIIKLTDKPKERILVRFNPLCDELIFIGQHKPHNKPWVDFSMKINKIWGDNETIITLDDIQEMLYDTYSEMKTRLDGYEEIAEGFSVIKEIEIKEEE